MKKKLLFVMESLGIGGAEKSLVTLLSNIDYSQYEVDLFLFNQTGEFLSLVPRQVNILDESENYYIISNLLLKSPLLFLKKRNLTLFLSSISYILHLIFYRYILKKEYIGWNIIKRFIAPIDKQYDTAIGFLEKKTIYFTSDFTKSKRKIGFIHNDYEKIEHDIKMDNKYFYNLNSIVTVSEHCADVLKGNFPNHKDKVVVIKNMISKSIIENMASEQVEDINFNEKEIIICTVARLVKQKGIDNAIKVCDILVSKGLNIRWYVIGDGHDQEYLKNLIKDKSLEGHFILMGARTNPYKYMHISDIYVQPSLYEGYGITVAEAKVLKKPIVASDIPEFREQIIPNKTGILCATNNDMVEAILKIINNKKVAKELENNLREEVISCDELKKLNNILC